MLSFSKDKSGETIHIGLVLAGAVTAGAYTAGVLDYLFNTLKLWQKRYEEDPENIPKPNVVVDIFTGASAGSIAAATALIALVTDSFDEVKDPYRAEAEKNLLFNTWINFGLKDNDITEHILSTEDLDQGTFDSLLNVDFMDRLIDKIVKETASKKLNPLPPYINPNPDILFTLSNLRGIPIDLYFDTDNQRVAHTMSYHKAFAYFQYQKINNDPSKLGLDFSNEGSLRFFLKCARASGAFPLGLKSVSFSDIPKDYVIGNLKRIFGDDFKFVPRIDDNYSFTAVDGGMTNNEPIAEALKAVGKKYNKNYKLIMVDPFPNHIPSTPFVQKTVKNDIFHIIPQLISTLRNQASFKESDIADMFDDNTDKNMIWPTRYDKENRPLRNTIACGALSGFAGFINKDFRIHDYMLGKKNCQSFLRYYFHIEEELHLSASEWSEQLKESHAFEDSKTKKMMLPIIPDFRIESKKAEKERTFFFPFLNEDNTNGLGFPAINYQQHILPLEKSMNIRIKNLVDISYDYLRKKDDDATIPLIRKRNELVFIKNTKVKIWKILGYTFMKTVGSRFVAKTISNKLTNIIIEELYKYKLLK
jgi:hypothetical protein